VKFSPGTIKDRSQQQTMRAHGLQVSGAEYWYGGIEEKW
jgi:hypothetical protein